MRPAVDVGLGELSDGSLRGKLRALGESDEGGHGALVARLRGAMGRGGVPIEVLNSMVG